MKSSRIDSQSLLKAIGKVQHMFIQDRPIQDVFDQMLKVLLDITESEYGFIGEILHDGQQDYLKTHAITNIAWNEATRKFYKENAPNGLEFKNLKTLFGRVITDKTFLISNNPNTDERRGGLPEGHPHMSSFLGMPIKDNGNMCGMFGIANRPGGYDPIIVEELDPIVEACSNLIRGYKIIKERNDSTKLLKQSNKKLQEKNERLEEFTYVISHDFRKHTSNLKMLSEVLINEDNIDEKLEIFNLMSKSINHLNITVDYIAEIVDFDKKVSSERVIVNLKDIIDNILASHIIHATTINMENRVPKDISINTRFAYVNSICENLISNAIRYRKSEKAHLIITASLADNNIILSFEDNGIGINLDQYGSDLFKMYATFHGNDEARGIGLFLVKKYIDSLGWKIEVFSEVNEGTKFRITIPI